MSNIQSNPVNPGKRVQPASEGQDTTPIGESFLEALAAQDFDRIQVMFAPQVRFRALVPSGLREGSTAAEATGWLRRWFGGAEKLQVLRSAAGPVFGRLYVSYRVRLYDPTNDWRLIEQHVYCDVKGGCIADMELMCSGFWKEVSGSLQKAVSQDQASRPGIEADEHYDAGNRDCAEGPIDEIAVQLRKMNSGQVLDIQASDPSVAEDIPAFCRLSGHEFVKQEGDHYLVRRK
jgi:tRNA 2-thiouridine synthesizing protein A